MKDIHNSDKVLNRAIERLSELPKKNQALITEFIEDCGLGRHKAAGKQVKSHKRTRYANFLMEFSKIVKHKDLTKLTEKEYTTFVIDLKDDKIKKHNGQIFSIETKRCWVITVNLFLKWLEYSKKIEELDIRLIGNMARSDPDANHEEPVLRKDWEALAEFGETKMGRAAIMVLLDSGARAQEFLNLQVKDVEQIDDTKTGRKKCVIHIRVSKTKARKVDLPYATDKLLEWLKIHPERLDPEAYLFPMTYDQLGYIVAEAGRNAFKRKLHPHLLRHSSATYWCPLLGEYLSDKRFGWAFGSGQGRRYVNIDFINANERTDAIYADTEGLSLSKRNKEIEDKMATMQMQFNKKIENLQKVLAIVAKDNVKLLDKHCPNWDELPEEN